MATSVLPSTFFLTVLLATGLFFFIRASTKDRTEIVKLRFDQPHDVALTQLQQYFAQRAYRVATVDSEKLRVTFAGFVRPSWFLAIFLTVLAAVGLSCLSLVLAILLPDAALWTFVLVGLSPLAGFFYWRGAARPETVVLQVESSTPLSADALEGDGKSLVTVSAHRDELAVLQRTLPCQTLSLE